MVSFNPDIMQGAVYKVLGKMMGSLQIPGEPQDHLEVATYFDERMDSRHGRLNVCPKTAEGVRLATLFDDYMKKIEKKYGQGIVRKMPSITKVEVIK